MTEISQLENTIMNMAADARKAATSLISLSSAKKNIVLERVASLLDSQRTIIQSENEKDLKAGREKGLSAAMLDRLELSDAVIDSMISGLKEVCALPDPVGSVDNLTIRPNGIQVD